MNYNFQDSRMTEKVILLYSRVIYNSKLYINLLYIAGLGLNTHQMTGNIECACSIQVFDNKLVFMFTIK